MNKLGMLLTTTILLGVNASGQGVTEELSIGVFEKKVGFVADDGADIPPDAVSESFIAETESEHSHDVEVGPGLGDYGDEGPITRSQIRVGLRDYVSDQAIAVAASSDLAAARSSWDQTQDFVDQVDYQLSFRSRYDFLDASPAHIGAVLLVKPVNTSGIEEMSLYLTSSEAAELARRDQLGDQIELIEKSLSTNWNGADSVVDIWQDQQNSGKITLFTTKRQAILKQRAEQLAGRGNLHVVVVPYDSTQYQMYRNELSSQMQATGLAYKLGTSRSASSYALEITVEDPAQLPDDIGNGVPADAYRVVAGPAPSPSGLPQANHADDDLQPGQMLYLNRPEGWTTCTWGVNGHTNNWNYVVTAGHCLGDTLWDSSGWIGNDLEVWTGSANTNTIFDNLTPGNVFLHSRLRTTFDVARANSGDANTNCYHGTSGDPARDCPWRIQNRAWHDSWETGSDRTCASLGRSNTYRCGPIVDEDVELNYGANFDNWTTNRAVEVGFSVIGGDSGSGTKWNNTIDGMIICCQGTTNSFMITAYDMKRGLGSTFDFNCAVGFTRQAANLWGACPGTNR